MNAEPDLWEYDLWIIIPLLLSVGLVLIFGFNSMVRKGFNDDPEGYQKTSDQELTKALKKHNEKSPF